MVKRVRPNPELRMKDLHEGAKLKVVRYSSFFTAAARPVVRREGVRWVVWSKKFRQNYYLNYNNVCRFTFAEGPW